jgi:16S rRNA (guanine966-N2)-methyltransferase
MRIIAGKHKGRKVEVGRAATQVRPTSGFAREAIFNIVTHGQFQGLLDGANVADIFCGSGALGLEALSRGAAHVTFVDNDHHALQSARRNAAQMGEEGNAVFLRADAAQLPPARAEFQLILLDPPYFGTLLPQALASLLAQGWIGAETLVVAEHDARENPPLPAGLAIVDERRYGRATIRLLHRAREAG